MEKIEEFVKLTFGDGSDYGLGYGDGSGDGYGNGYGDGSGNGHGDGSGYGSGNGSGNGYGDGHGDGSGYGIKTYNGMLVSRIDGLQTIITSVRGNVAKGFIVKDDFTLTKCFVAKQNNTFAHGETLHAAMEALRDKLFEEMPEEERVEAFMAEFKLDKSYPVKSFYEWHNRLTGSCEMGRKQFAQEKDINIEHDTMTVAEFINLTKNAYGGDVIGKLEEKYEGENNGTAN